MPVKFSRFANVDRQLLLNAGAFDPILDVDTRLFLDPHLLSKTEVPELRNSYARLQSRFQDIATLLLASETKEDPFWRAADRLMIWPEVKGLCVGYTSKGTSGRGMGDVIRARLLDTASRILRKGIQDPVIFELVGLFERDVGPDLIGDMTANIIRDDLVRYSRRTIEDVKIDLGRLKIDDDAGLPVNPYSGVPIILVPRELLRDLPIAFDWRDRDRIEIENEHIRAEVNAMVGETWKQATTKVSKQSLKDTALAHMELIDDLIRKYKERGAERYDFEEDRAGQYVWADATSHFAAQYPIRLALSPAPTADEVERFVLAICEQFKKLVEQNGLAKLFYDRNGKVKHEEAMQLLFYGIAESYCIANNIMIARESDAGRGPVDFKFGTNMQNSVLLEVKKSTNTSGLKKGITKQLPTYMNAEGSRRAIYLVIDVGYSKAAMGNLRQINTSIANTAIKLFHVDGMRKPSGSKA